MTNAATVTVSTPSDRELRMTRGFAAPRSLVFDALTKPELLTRWLGVFDGWTFVQCEVDLRVGGAFRFVWNGPDGASIAMRGVYREIVRPERIVQTETFDDPWYAGCAVSTAILTEAGGTTTLTTTIVYDSQEIRDAVLRSPMEGGVSRGYDALDRVLAEQTASESVAARYRRHADAFERKVAAVRPEQWSNPSPCAAWDARGVLGHIVDMHGYMLHPLGRQLPAAPTVQDDPLGAFRAARAAIQAILDDPALAGTESDTPSGRLTAEQHIDRVVSEDLVLHGWDLARATGQNDPIDPIDLERIWSAMSSMPPEIMEQLRTPGAFGPGIEVFGPEVQVPESAPIQDRLLGMVGRNPY